MFSSAAGNKNEINNGDNANNFFFSNQTLLELIDYLFQFIQMKMMLLKDLKLKDNTYQKRLLKIIMSSSMEKNFYDQPITSDTKLYEEVRKLTTGRLCKDYSTGRLLDYEYIENHYRLIAFDLIREKELDVDRKAIQQIEFVGQLKN